MIRLEVRNGPEEGREIELGPGSHVLGRRAPADLVLAGDAISGRHLELTVTSDGQVTFQDLGSTNGTWAAGLKTEKGEWTPGADLRLGNLVLRRLDGAPDLAEDDSETQESEESRRRRRNAAQELSAPRRTWPLVLLVLILGGGGAAWYFMQPEPGSEPVARTPTGAGIPSGPSDLLQGLGSFPADSGASWRLSESVVLENGSLRATQTGRADLLETLSWQGEIKIQADVQGGQVWAIFALHFADSEAKTWSWACPSLGATPLAIRFPEGSDAEFSLSLKMEAGTEVRSLLILESEGAPVRQLSSSDGRRFFTFGGNLQLQGLGGDSLLQTAAPSGAWEEAAVGLRYLPEGSDWLFLASPDPFLVLTMEESLHPTPGLLLAGATGLLWQGDQRLLMTFESPVSLRMARDGVWVAAPSALVLDWQLSQPLAEAARLDRAIQRAAQQEDTATLLVAVAELLRRWPLDEDQVARAETLRAEAIIRGRSELDQLERATAEALFLGASKEMHRVAAQADLLANALPQTDVAEAALTMARDLRSEASQASQSQEQQRLNYRRRLLTLLKSEYPLLASWVQDGGGT